MSLFRWLVRLWLRARARDCERTGGHRWTASTWTVNGDAVFKCVRCGCAHIAGSTASNTTARLAVTVNGGNT